MRFPNISTSISILQASPCDRRLMTLLESFKLSLVQREAWIRFGICDNRLLHLSPSSKFSTKNQTLCFGPNCRTISLLDRSLSWNAKIWHTQFQEFRTKITETNKNVHLQTMTKWAIWNYCYRRYTWRI